MLGHENLFRLQQKEKSVVIFSYGLYPLQQKEKNVVKPHGGPSQSRFGGQSPEGLNALIPSQTEWRDAAIHQDRLTETKKI